MENIVHQSATATRQVTDKDTAKEVKSGTLPVLATPMLSAVMEEAAVAAIAPYLEEGLTTVGGYIAVTHKAPTAIGDTVTATATITDVKGKKISYHITAKDSKKDIGEADHTRFIVNGDDFMKKL